MRRFETVILPLCCHFLAKLAHSICCTGFRHWSSSAKWPLEWLRWAPYIRLQLLMAAHCKFNRYPVHDRRMSVSDAQSASAKPTISPLPDLSYNSLYSNVPFRYLSYPMLFSKAITYYICWRQQQRRQCLSVIPGPGRAAVSAWYGTDDISFLSFSVCGLIDLHIFLFGSEGVRTELHSLIWNFSRFAWIYVCWSME